jgi:hypothetical protein
MKRKCVCLSTSVGFAAHLCGASAAVAQTAPPLGAAQSIAVLGGSTVTERSIALSSITMGSS